MSCRAHGWASLFLEQQNRLEIITPLQARAKKFNFTHLLLLSHKRLTGDDKRRLVFLDVFGDTSKPMDMFVFRTNDSVITRTSKKKKIQIVTSIDN